MNRTPRLDRVFQALADPTRRHILVTLSKGERPVMDLVRRFKISQPAVTKHLQVLERAGLIARRQEGRERRCRLRPEALAAPLDWITTCRQHWNERLDTLEILIASLHAEPGAFHE